MGEVTQELLRRIGDPGAIGLLALLGVGAALCFLGCRAFRFSAGVAGLVVGLELMGHLAMRQGWGSVVTIIVAVLGAAAVCALFVLFAFLGVFGLGAMLSATLVTLAAHASGGAMKELMLVLAGLIGGFGALMFRKPVVVVATALYGAMAAMASLFALSSGGGVEKAVRTMASPRETGDVSLYLLCLAVLVTGGIAVQFRYGGSSSLDGARQK